MAGATTSQNGSQPNVGSTSRRAGKHTTAATPSISQTCNAAIHSHGGDGVQLEATCDGVAIMTSLRFELPRSLATRDLID